MLMLLLLTEAASSLSKSARKNAEAQELFDKLVSAADYSVKNGAVMRSGSLRFPNWIDERLLVPDYAEGIRASEGLSRLYIGLAAPEDGFSACIYRIVVVGPERTVGRLFVCGD